MPGGVVDMDNAFAGGAVVAGACQGYRFLRRFLVAIRNRVGGFAAISLQAAAHGTIAQAPLFLTAGSLEVCTFLGQFLASPRLSAPWCGGLLRSLRPLYQLPQRHAQTCVLPRRYSPEHAAVTVVATPLKCHNSVRTELACPEPVEGSKCRRGLYLPHTSPLPHPLTRQIRPEHTARARTYVYYALLSPRSPAQLPADRVASRYRGRWQYATRRRGRRW